MHVSMTDESCCMQQLKITCCHTLAPKSEADYRVTTGGVYVVSRVIWVNARTKNSYSRVIGLRKAQIQKIVLASTIKLGTRVYHTHKKIHGVMCMCTCTTFCSPQNITRDFGARNSLTPEWPMVRLWPENAAYYESLPPSSARRVVVSILGPQHRAQTTPHVAAHDPPPPPARPPATQTR